MKVLYIAAECKPFSKTGGVGDVTGELPPALRKQRVDIEIAAPLYGCINKRYIGKSILQYSVPFHGANEHVEIHAGHLNGVPVNFVSNRTYFENIYTKATVPPNSLPPLAAGDYSKPYVNSEEVAFYDDALRFSFFSKACLRLIEKMKPDIVQINDWLLGYLFGWMEIEKFPQKRILTVHNIGYQGNIGRATIKGWDIEEILKSRRTGVLFADPRKGWKSVNALRLGLELSDMVNTVSPNYAKEMTQPEDQQRYFEGGKGLDKIAKRLYDEGRLIGILNGFDYKFEPTVEKFIDTVNRKKLMKKALSGDFADPDAFLLGFVGRAVEQKFKLLAERINGKSVLEHILDLPGINAAILATGLPQYESFLKKIAHTKNYSVTVAFDKDKAQQISLGGDVFLMPSLFEPCGITQMESLSNATPPLVRWTGGLVDTVIPHTATHGTGFGFSGSSRKEILRNLISCCREALNVYRLEREHFQEVQRQGFQQRFLWSDSARQYIERMYVPVMAK